MWALFALFAVCENGKRAAHTVLIALDAAQALRYRRHSESKRVELLSELIEYNHHAILTFYARLSLRFLARKNTFMFSAEMLT